MANPLDDDLTIDDLAALSEDALAFMKQYAVREICADDITIGMAMKLWNVGDKAARDRMDDLTRQGKMTMIGKVRASNGRTVWAWQIVKEPAESE